MFGKKKLQAELEKSQRVVELIDRSDHQKGVKNILLEGLFKASVLDCRYRIVATSPPFKELRAELLESGWKIFDSFSDLDTEYEIWIPAEVAIKLGQDKKSTVEASITELWEQVRISLVGYKELWGRIEAIENRLDSKGARK